MELSRDAHTIGLVAFFQLRIEFMGSLEKGHPQSAAVALEAVP